MPDNAIPRRLLDARILIYRFARDIGLFVVLVLLIKYAACDTALIQTDQMGPALAAGDRVVLFRTPFIPPYSWIVNPRAGGIVVFADPHRRGRLNCLRVAGLPGDSLAVQNGQFVNLTRPRASFSVSAADSDVLPPDYTPRDFTAPLRLPQRGENLSLDDMSIRDFFFAVSIIRQENPKKTFAVQPQLFIDDQPAPGFRVTEFALFAGTLDTVPEKYRYDFFFSDRLRAFLEYSQGGKSISFLFSLMENGEPVHQYRVKGTLVFLLADDWYKGYDSRYFGPISARLIKGGVTAVLWSFAHDRPWFKALRWDRIVKIVR